MFVRADAPHVYVRALDTRMLPQSYQYPNISEGAEASTDSCAEIKSVRFSGVTSFGRVWKKVLESDARKDREKERDKQTDRHTDTQIDRDRDRESEKI